MAIVDDKQQANDLETLKKDLQEAVTTPAATVTPAAAETPEDDFELPEKFKGKTTKDIVGAYENLQSAYGRMANDLGTQRKLIDELLDLKRTSDIRNNDPTPAPKLDREKLFDDPETALSEWATAREKQREKPLEQKVQELERELTESRFLAKHPDIANIAQDPRFTEWVQASAIRRKYAEQAQQGSFTAADELLTEFKETVSKQTPAKEEAAKADLEGARKAATERSGTAGGGTKPTGKVYSRAALLELKLRQPEVYQDHKFQAEILKAYAEGRVK